MEHNVFDVSEDISFPWLPAYAEAEQSLGNSSRILETIVEETSDDEDNSHQERWSQFDHVWSSSGGSDTGSVIRVGTPSDQDTMSERDFICPAKRRKQESDDFIIDSSPIIINRKLRDPDLLETTEYFMKRHNDQRLRFDEIGHELFTDSDSLSYASLSRSSSLIQFESLERQLQSDSSSQQTFSGSSPSIYFDSYETTNNGSNNNNNNNKKSNLLTTYKTSIQQQKTPQNILNISDSEIYSSSSCASSNSSSANSSSYNSDDCDLINDDSGDSIVLVEHPEEDDIRSPSGSPNDKIFGRCSLNNCVKKLRSKNSIESLSEDSGYCDHLHFNMNNLKVRSKSLTNFNSAENLNVNLFDELMFSPPLPRLPQENAFHHELAYGENRLHLATNKVLSTVYDDVDENEENVENHEEEDESDDEEEEEEEECDVWFKNSKNSRNNNNNCTKIDFQVISKHSATNSTSSSSFSSDHVERSSLYDHPSKNTPSSTKEEENSSLNFHQKIISTSSPDLFSISCENNHIRINQKCLTTINDYSNVNFVVSSVPDCLNLCGTNNNINHNNAVHDNFGGGAFDSIANKDFNLYDFQPQNQQKQHKKTVTFHQHIDQPQQQSKKPQNLRASYANLTILDYSDDEEDSNQYYMSKMGHQNQNNNAFSSLLDEITSHFDRNLSIINDQCAEYEPIAAFLNEQRGFKFPTNTVAPVASSTPKSNKMKPPSHPPPQPPPRQRTQIKTNPHQSGPSASGPKMSIIPQITVQDMNNDKIKKKTFDQDPTNLVTCYTESLERCNFDLSDSSQYLYRENSNNNGSDLNVNEPTIQHYSTPIKRDFIASTPNLNYYHHYYDDEDDNNHHYHTEKETKNHSTSMKNLRNTGILSTSGGSKANLSKGVSFCPIVSEIVWKETTAESIDDSNDHVDHVQQQEMIIMSESAPPPIPPPPIPPPPIFIPLPHPNELENEQKQMSKSCDDFYDIFNDYDDDPFTVDQYTYTKQHDFGCIKDKYTDSMTNIHRNTNINNKQQQHMVNSCSNEQNSASTSSSIKMISEEKSSIVCGAATHNNNNNNNTTSNLTINNSSALLNKESNMNVNNNFILAESTSSGGNNNGVVVTNKPPINNNLIKNNKNLKVDANNKKGRNFLSRLSSGFRFSFRHKSKKNKENVVIGSGAGGGVINQLHPQLPPSTSDNKNVKNNKNNMNNNISVMTNDIIYIPLKDTINQDDDDELFRKQANTVGLALSDEDTNQDHVDNSFFNESDFNSSKLSDSSKVLNSTMNNNGHVLISKPPLPKLPPRVVGVCAKRSTTPNRFGARASSTPPREIDADNNSYYYPSNISSNTNDSTFEGTGGLLRREYSPDDDNSDYMMGSEQKIGLIETNLDTHETIISGKTRSLMELGGPHQLQIHNPHNAKRMSGSKQTAQNVNEPGRPHKSMEFLLDKENQRNVLPPENELQKSHENGTNLSEHQLRVQASLQKLNVPDWYKQYSKDTTQPTPVGILKKRNSDVGRWTGLSSKTTSLSSLGSHKSDRSPVMLSPSAHSHHGGQTTGFSRWSTSHLNSNQTSPSVSTRGSFSRGGVNASILSGYSTATTNTSNYGANTSVRSSFRQPYLGWRSQEKLSQPRTPAERLASSLLTQTKQQEQQKQEQVVTPEIQSSIKEVTSAIVHYVNDQNSRNSRSRSASPSQRCWLESSFVGTRPLESPTTPVIENSSVLGQSQSEQMNELYRYNCVNGVGESTLI